MNALLDSYCDQLSILAFPCNQFGHQEPGRDATEILNGLKYVRPAQGYTPHKNLTMMLKGDVNGVSEIPLYTYLKSSCPIMPKLASFKPSECFWGERIQPNDITWNFEKFIVAPNGVPIFRLSQRVWPEDMHDLLSALMSPVDEDMDSQRNRLESLLNHLDAKVEARYANK